MDQETQQPIVIDPTSVTPYVMLDTAAELFEIKGRSSPENSVQFYQEILEGLDDFLEKGDDQLTANFAFEYFNTSSSKCLFDVFKKISRIEESGKTITINWFYEEDDDDMMEAGEDYSDLLELEFNFLEIED